MSEAFQDTDQNPDIVTPAAGELTPWQRLRGLADQIPSDLRDEFDFEALVDSVPEARGKFQAQTVDFATHATREHSESHYRPDRDVRKALRSVERAVMRKVPAKEAEVASKLVEQFHPGSTTGFGEGRYPGVTSEAHRLTDGELQLQVRAFTDIITQRTIENLSPARNLLKGRLPLDVTRAVAEQAKEFFITQLGAKVSILETTIAELPHDPSNDQLTVARLIGLQSSPRQDVREALGELQGFLAQHAGVPADLRPHIVNVLEENGMLPKTGKAREAYIAEARELLEKLLNLDTLAKELKSESTKKLEEREAKRSRRHSKTQHERKHAGEEKAAPKTNAEDSKNVTFIGLALSMAAEVHRQNSTMSNRDVRRRVKEGMLEIMNKWNGFGVWEGDDIKEALDTVREAYPDPHPNTKPESQNSK
jgi:hypothetical protein